MKNKWFTINALLIFAFIMLGNISSLAQYGPVSPLAADELRPFDFSDKYYLANGVMPNMLLKRHSGEDGFSIPDRTSDPDHTDVRILATHPAYGRDGEKLYWNFYGELYKDAFTDDVQGQAAYETALNFPIYMFPGQTRKGDRQAPIIDLTEGYFEKNVLGLGLVMVVEYNPTAVVTKKDAIFLEELGKQNGLSADGTPVIRTTAELELLRRRGLITIGVRETNDPAQVPFIVGKVIQNPGFGSITPDAFLLYTKDSFEKPLESEISFLKTFNCLKKQGSTCF